MKGILVVVVKWRQQANLLLLIGEALPMSPSLVLHHVIPYHLSSPLTWEPPFALQRLTLEHDCYLSKILLFSHLLRMSHAADKHK